MQTNPLFNTEFYPAQTLLKFKKKAVAVSAPISDQETGIETVYQLYEHSFEKFPDRPCLGTRINNGPYVFKTYAEDKNNFGAGLKYLYSKHVGLDQPWFLGIFAINRYEWMISDLGALSYAIPAVALYDTLGPDASEFILNHAEVPIVSASIDKVPILIELAQKCPALKVVIVMDLNTPKSTGPLSILEVCKKWGASVGLHVVAFTEVLELGKRNPLAHTPPTRDDIFCLSYTSGTTGDPKGAMISNANLVSVVRSNVTFVDLGPEDSHISYLPLAHIFERVCMAMTLANGGSSGFFRGDVTLLVEDIAALRPTLFPSVPRLLNRIYDKIIAGALHSGSNLKATLFTKAREAKTSNLHSSGSLTHSIWDPLVFNKVKNLLGGRVRYVVSGSAPIGGHVLEFLRIALGCQVLEGYGQTESCGALTVAWPGDYSTGHVGNPVPCNEIKLVSVPDMGYHAKELKGEIWCRGSNVFKGYFKDPEKTKDTITPDGWLKTGDIGVLDKYGHVSIVDRKKNIFKLSQGEYVAAEKLENIFARSQFVSQILVHGDSLQNELVAIVVPEQEYCIGWAKRKGLLPSDTPVPIATTPGKPPCKEIVELSKSKELNEKILEDMTSIGKQEKLRGFEFCKAVFLEPVAFSIENGTLTPTFKLKRHDLAQKYRKEIDAMYEILNSKPAAAKL